ncbi:MAG: ABC transporter permease [Candidatus Bathyarchaeia archaeon]
MKKHWFLSPKGLGNIFVAAILLFYVLFPMLVVVFWSVAEKWYPEHWWAPEKVGLSWFKALFKLVDVQLSFIQTFTIAPIVVVLTALISIPAGYIFGTKSFPGKRFLENVFLIPLVVPAIATGISILSVYTAWGLRNTYWGVILAHMIGATPYMLRCVSAAFEGIDPAWEEAARNLGATRWQVIWKILVPNIAPGILAGAIFAFSWSIIEFVLTLLIGFPSVTTLAVKVYQYIGGYYITPNAAAAVSIFLTLPSIPIVLAMEKYVKAEYVAGVAR